jgi:hypothetical protein
MTIKTTLKRIISNKYHGAIRRLPYFFFDRLVDRDSWAPQEHIKTSRLILRSMKYKLAGLGIPATKNERGILALHNLHAGQRVFILGNGPSLNKCDLSLLHNEIIFGVNNIFLNYKKMGFHPTYYVVEDTLLAEDRSTQINAYHGPRIKFFGNYLRYCFNNSPETIWLNIIATYENYPGFPHFSKNAARKVWAGGTVTYICMQLAYYMGFKEVYLVGFDHSYNIPTDANVDDQTREITSRSYDPNHFDSNYFGKGYRWHNPEVERMGMAYARARQVFESDNRTIINATIGGHLNVFPRVDFIDLFKTD